MTTSVDIFASEFPGSIELQNALLKYYTILQRPGHHIVKEQKKRKNSNENRCGQNISQSRSVPTTAHFNIKVSAGVYGTVRGQIYRLLPLWGAISQLLNGRRSDSTRALSHATVGFVREWNVKSDPGA